MYSATLSIIIYSLTCLCRARRTSKKIKLVYTMTRFQLRANWKRSRLNWSSVNRLAMFLLINLASALHADYSYPTPYPRIGVRMRNATQTFIGNILLMRNYVYDRTRMWGSKSLPLASRGWFLKIILNKKKNRQRKINTIIDLSVFLFILQHLRRFLAEKKDNIKISEAVIDQTEETEEVRILYHNLWIQDKCLKLKVFWVALR